MEYKNVDGVVYSRYASSPPVINSEMAWKFGIQVPCPMEPGHYTQFNVGSNVKLRIVIERGNMKMTCHAMIDWVEKDEDLVALAREEHDELAARRDALLEQMREVLNPPDPRDSKNTFLEIRPGTGGGEAALFAADLARMERADGVGTGSG